MDIKRIFLPFATATCLGWASPVSAQVEKAFHQVIPADEAYILNFLVNEEFEVISWSGNTILVEGIVSLDCCDPNMLNHIVKTGRYNLNIETSADVVSLVSNRRPPLTIKGNPCQEKVKIKISVPESYTMVTKKQCLLVDSPVFSQKKQ